MRAYKSRDLEFCEFCASMRLARRAFAAQHAADGGEVAVVGTSALRGQLPPSESRDVLPVVGALAAVTMCTTAVQWAGDYLTRPWEPRGGDTGTGCAPEKVKHLQRFPFRGTEEQARAARAEAVVGAAIRTGNPDRLREVETALDPPLEADNGVLRIALATCKSYLDKDSSTDIAARVKTYVSGSVNLNAFLTTHNIDVSNTSDLDAVVAYLLKRCSVP